MCGLAGFFGSSFNTEFGISILNSMGNQIAHRGPDDKGTWIDANTSIGLVHRRLAIQDLSREGHQPMFSKNKRYVLVYNGEIYNFQHLRQELKKKGAFFNGYSDTEVLLAAITSWGIKETVKRLIGMFAFALWDRELKTLVLARDRMGEKPLYYGWQGKSFLFGSELKALKKHPEFKGEIDRDSLCLLLRYNNISSPKSIYKNISKLPPASILTLDCKSKKSIIEHYWSLEEHCKKSICQPFQGDELAAVNELEILLINSIKDQMVADVPVGAFLSGGIDSSLVATIMQQNSSKSVKTFSIGFEDDDYNEAKYANEISKFLQTDHSEFYVQPKDALNIIPKLPEIYDEPFADSSQIPTYLLSHLAQQQVQVVLTGDGGDEIFGGYNRHYWVKFIWNKIRFLPSFTRHLSSNIISRTSIDKLDKIFNLLMYIIPTKFNISQPGKKVHKLASILKVNSEKDIFATLTSYWNFPEEVVINSNEPNTIQLMPDKWPELNSIENQMMFIDTITYLPDDILTKVDRASMSVGLELRVPMLNHHLVEFAWSLPQHMKIKNQSGKWILKQLLYKYLPPKLIDRPKMGFSLPLEQWLRGPLKDWVESLLDENRLIQEGFFNAKPIREKWMKHSLGDNNFEHQLWNVIMFQAWLELEKN